MNLRFITLYYLINTLKKFTYSNSYKSNLKESIVLFVLKASYKKLTKLYYIFFMTTSSGKPGLYMSRAPRVDDNSRQT